MALFQVLQKTNSTADIVDDDSVLIIEKFNWLAAIFPPFWLMAKNLWVELVLWFAFIIALSAVSSFIGSEAIFWIYIISAIYIGFEAPNIQIKSLKRKGFIAQGDLIAQDYEQAQVAWIKYRLGHK